MFQHYVISTIFLCTIHFSLKYKKLRKLYTLVVFLNFFPIFLFFHFFRSKTVLDFLFLFFLICSLFVFSLGFAYCLFIGFLDFLDKIVYISINSPVIIVIHVLI